MHIQPHSLRLAAAPLVAIIAGNATTAVLHTLPLREGPHALTGLALRIVFVAAGTAITSGKCRHRITMCIAGTAQITTFALTL